MSQLSLFSADLTPPRVEDLGGLLAAHGQVSRGVTGTRLSILLADEWRAKALLREFRVRDIDPEQLPAELPLPNGTGPRRPGVLLRCTGSTEVEVLAEAWNTGAVKSVPAGLVVGAGLLRCWTLAAGRADESGFVLGLDRHAGDTFEPLASACARAGLAGSLIGVRSSAPGLRIVGSPAARQTGGTARNGASGGAAGRLPGARALSRKRPARPESASDETFHGILQSDGGISGTSASCRRTALRREDPCPPRNAI